MSILPPQDLLTLRHSDIVSNIEDKMDSMKSATGLGSNTDDASLKSGEEPVSGQKGQGTAEEPYDQGNAEGSEGAPAKEGMSGVLGDTKRKAEELLGKGS